MRLAPFAHGNVKADYALETFWNVYLPQPTQFAHFVDQRVREFRVLGHQLGSRLKDEEVVFLDDVMLAAHMVKALRDIGPEDTMEGKDLGLRVSGLRVSGLGLGLGFGLSPNP